GQPLSPAGGALLQGGPAGEASNAGRQAGRSVGCSCLSSSGADTRVGRCSTTLLVRRVHDPSFVKREGSYASRNPIGLSCCVCRRLREWLFDPRSAFAESCFLAFIR